MCRYVWMIMGMVCAMATCHASVVVSGTRVVFPAAEHEVSVKLRNEGNTPGLVQVWLDHGDRDDVPEQVKVPFVLTPPLFRLDPHQGQTIRILSTDEALPEDRETLFWLNVLEVPPKPDTANAGNHNLIQMAFRTRLKLFYRPAALSAPQDIERAYTHIVWKIEETEQHHARLVAHNKTPYFMTITKVRLGDAEQDIDTPVMLAPEQTYQFPITLPSLDVRTSHQIIFSVINDYGSEIQIQSAS